MTMTADGTMNPRIMRDQLYVFPVIEVSDQFGLQLKSYCPLLLIPRILIHPQRSKECLQKVLLPHSGHVFLIVTDTKQRRNCEAK